VPVTDISQQYVDFYGMIAVTLR